MVKTDNFVPVQDLAGNILMVEPEKKKRGRPKKQAENITMTINEIKKRGRPRKYATTEEARKAKIANTIKGAKKRKQRKGGMVVEDEPQPQPPPQVIEQGTRDIFNDFMGHLEYWNSHPRNQQALDQQNHYFDGMYDINNPNYTLQQRQMLGVWFNFLAHTQNRIDDGDVLPTIVEPSIEYLVNNPDAELGVGGGGLIKKRKAKGKGLFSGIKKAVKSVSNTATSVANKVKDTATAVVYGRQDYPPKVRKILSQYGGKNITGITLGRTPLGTPLMIALQVASGNTFSQKLENTPYDKLFHLFMCIELDSSSKIVLEKNEVINAEIGCKLPKETETQTITSSDIPTGLTLNDALEKTRERMGGNFFTYSAKDNNCQDFIVAFLTANNIGTETDKSWVKQETKVLFEGNNRLRKIANTLTDIGARVDVLRQGAGIESDSDSDSSTSSSSSSSSGGSMNGGGIVDFEDLKWGSFSKQLQQYNRTHKPKLDLHSFAMMILANPKKFNKRTIKRARFYINIILKNGEKGGMINEENDPLFQNPLPIAINLPPPPPNSPVRPLPPARKRKVVVDVKKKRGQGIKKSPVNNIGMANKWIEYVKAYAKKHNLKYNDALKDPKCKAGYKKGEGLFDVLKSVGQAVAPVAIDLASDYAKKKVSGGGMPTSRDEYISQLYEQANLGANGRVNLN